MTNPATEKFNPNTPFLTWVFKRCRQHHLPTFWQTGLPVLTLYRLLMADDAYDTESDNDGMTDDGNDTEADVDEGWMDPYLIFAVLNTQLSANDIRALYVMNSPESDVPDMRPCAAGLLRDQEYLARGSQCTPQYDWHVLCLDGLCDDGVAFPDPPDREALAASLKTRAT
jgi:hypothetical protein